MLVHETVGWTRARGVRAQHGVPNPAGSGQHQGLFALWEACNPTGDD